MIDFKTVMSLHTWPLNALLKEAEKVSSIINENSQNLGHAKAALKIAQEKYDYYVAKLIAINDEMDSRTEK